METNTKESSSAEVLSLASPAALNNDVVDNNNDEDNFPQIKVEELEEEEEDGNTDVDGGVVGNSQLFCLRWNNYQTNLTNVFDQLLQNESFVDVTLACGDGHTVKAHKMVLSACSPYFQSLFFENPCKHPIVILKDIKWSELKAAVEFMYKGEINVCQEQIGPLLKVAESLKIRGLADVSNEHDLSNTTSNISNNTGSSNTTNSNSSNNRSSNSNNSSNNNKYNDNNSSNNNYNDNKDDSHNNNNNNNNNTSNSNSSSRINYNYNDNNNNNNNSSSNHHHHSDYRHNPRNSYNFSHHHRHSSTTNGGNADTSITNAASATTSATNTHRRNYRRRAEYSPCSSEVVPSKSPVVRRPTYNSNGNANSLANSLTSLHNHNQHNDNDHLNRYNHYNHHQQPRKRRKMTHCVDRIEDYGGILNSPSTALELISSPTSFSSTGLFGPTAALNALSSSFLQGCSTSSASASCAVDNINAANNGGSLNSINPQSVVGCSSSSPPPPPINSIPLPLPLPPSNSSMSLSSSSGMPSNIPSATANLMLDDMEIKPGIAEMIREEERAKMLESSQAWLSASASGLTSDSYQYQLQSMWQKCWNTNQSLVHNLRFRERGPLKSWRPETMAEAILSVLKEGLSLSQAARKYDIPYPTFVLYANRVHNMLGPSADGGSDLRPKGRGRPQRILLGFWPEDHIQHVIRTVVFRDQQHMKDEPLNLVGYPRISEPLSVYGNGNSCMNSPEHPSSPNSTAAAVVAIAQGLRQQMLAAAAVAHSTSETNFGFFSQCTNGAPPNLLMATPLHSPHSTPPVSPSPNNLEVGLGMTSLPFKQNDSFPMSRTESLLLQEDIEDLVMKAPPPPSRNHITPTNDQHQQPLPLVLEQRGE